MPSLHAIHWITNQKSMVTWISDNWLNQSCVRNPWSPWIADKWLYQSSKSFLWHVIYWITCPKFMVTPDFGQVTDQSLIRDLGSPWISDYWLESVMGKNTSLNMIDWITNPKSGVTIDFRSVTGEVTLQHSHVCFSHWSKIWSDPRFWISDWQSLEGIWQDV